jgi:transposase
MRRFNYYVGIDVSKLTLDISMLCEQQNDTKTVYYKIENNKKSIAQFVKKTLEKYELSQILFCFEDTGIYSLPLSYYLNDNKLYYWKVPSLEIKRSKGIRRGKDDKIDSKDIAFYACTHLHKFRPSSIPPKSIQQLKLLFAEREKVLKSLSSFEKTSENKDFMPKDVFDIVVSSNKSVINKLKQVLKSLDEKMLAIIASENTLYQQYTFITSIPGIGKQTAIYLIIATKGFETFENWRQLACYSGVAPFPYQSGTSIRGRTKVHPLADKKLKTLLNLCAISAIRHDKEIKNYYERKVAEGKAKMLVINNVRCKLFARVFAVINRKSIFINTYKFAS